MTIFFYNKLPIFMWELGRADMRDSHGIWGCGFYFHPYRRLRRGTRKYQRVENGDEECKNCLCPATLLCLSNTCFLDQTLKSWCPHVIPLLEYFVFEPIWDCAPKGWILQIAILCVLTLILPLTTFHQIQIRPLKYSLHVYAYNKCLI